MDFIANYIAFHVKTKQYPTKQLMDPRRNIKENKNIPRQKWKQKYDNPKPMGCRKKDLPFFF